MIIKADNNTYFIFDLDDTLYPEIDFLKSGFKLIAGQIKPGSELQLYEKMLSVYKSGGNTFEYLLETYPESIRTLEGLIDMYRYHIPEIYLKPGVLEMLLKIKDKKGKIGIITNGRSITQHNKINSLGLEKFLDSLIISEEIGFEKPAKDVYKPYLADDKKYQYYYFGDNPKIDFIEPKRLGWYCIGVINEDNIHEFNINEFSQEYLPHVFINFFTEIEII